jgi:nucleoside-diphosphate-sugar epimerase
MRYLLTGANGYIGSRLVARLVERGSDVAVLGTAPPSLAASRVSVFPWRLGDDVPPQAFDNGTPRDDACAVIHLAHDWNAAEGESEPNQAGTARLLAAARSHGVRRFVFVSSLSARADALNRYGRIKYAIERLLRSPGEVAAQVGLVYGGPPRGMYRTMVRLTGLAPLLPMVDAHQLVQPIHIDEVCSGLIRLASESDLPRPIYRLAADQPITFASFLRQLANRQHGRNLRIVAIPRQLALWLADLSSRLPGVPRIDRERVLGLAGIRPRPTSADLRDLQLVVGPLEAASGELAPGLIAEGYALLRYCAGTKVSSATVRLYVRCLQRLGEDRPLALSWWALAMPGAIRLLDAMHGKDSPLRRRLVIAARIAEAGCEPTDRFYMVRSRPPSIIIAHLLREGLVEGCLMCLRGIFGLGGRS